MTARSALRRQARLLSTPEEYAVALAEIDALLDGSPEPGSPEEDRLEYLSVLVAAFDERHHRVALVAWRAMTPQEVVKVAAEERQAGPARLAEMLGGRSRVSEFYRGVRRLSLTQVQILRDELGIPADMLIAAGAATAVYGHGTERSIKLTKKKKSARLAGQPIASKDLRREPRGGRS